ncbi:1-phosphatidylinositol phosphodiesterase-like [Scomber scombrus]|uniref:1-phosphatidylinositol phosphodiesterase-like n=1 Tax=Scomber scombrus TaxID=13677 RepID=UPI002DD84C06|nr:1-phosphatidylinositol phosphodiesterase-like [Scomber scombrus]
MKSIPDDTPISAISIPGTHKSLSLYGGVLIQCQVWTLDQQLKVGLRYFDVHAGFKLPTDKDVIIRDAEQHVKELIQSYKSKMWTELSVPNMKQVRGKIVFLQSDTFRAGPKTLGSSFFEGGSLNNIEDKCSFNYGES